MTSSRAEPTRAIGTNATQAEDEEMRAESRNDPVAGSALVHWHEVAR
jgi:hypothetical protein